MDYALLRSWLGLPDGPWPPDHHTLLGLGAGPCDPAAVEALALARMDRLRPHQLLHPELVTEGMNRLAQALIGLTEPRTAASGSSFPLATVRDEQGDTGEHSPVSPDASPTLEIPFEPGLVPPEVGPPDDAPGSLRELIWEAERLPGAPSVPTAAVVEPPWRPPTRRHLFARLAAVRKLLAAWRKLGVALGDPTDPLTHPDRILALLGAAEEVRALLARVPVVGNVGRPGGVVVAVLRQPFVLHTVRLLLPDQRRAIATDWARAERALAREYDRLRASVQTVRGFRRVRRRRVAWWRVVRHPVTVLAALTVVAVVLAFLRVRRGG